MAVVAVRTLASLALVRMSENLGVIIAVSMPIIVIVRTSSINVNPFKLK